MAERKNFSGDRPAAFDYLGAARQSLMILKNDMSFNKLLTGSRTLDLPEGVRVYVACVFGQDTIDINVPPGTAVEALVRRQVQEEGRTIDAVPIEPEYESAFIKFDFTDNAFCNDRGILSMTKTFATPSYRIVICGGRGNSVEAAVPILWSSTSGMRRLALRDRIGAGDENSGWGYKLSADAAWVAGVVYVWDPTAVVQVGSKGAFIGRACVWKNPMTSDSNVIFWPAGNGGPNNSSYASVIDSNGTIRGNGPGTLGKTGLRWNGSHNGIGTFNLDSVAVPQTSGSVYSTDRKVEAQSNRYRVNSGAWITYADSQHYASSVEGFQDPTPSPITTSISF